MNRYFLFKHKSLNNSKCSVEETIGSYDNMKIAKQEAIKAMDKCNDKSYYFICKGESIPLTDYLYDLSKPCWNSRT